MRCFFFSVHVFGVTKARALANACSKTGHRISFFMRKGADCLSKWVGEAERQLRLLFEQARRHQVELEKGIEGKDREGGVMYAVL